MVRKQVYIEPRQERLLKRRARALGVTEAALIREGIELLDSARPAGASRERAMKELFAVIEERTRMRVPQTGRGWTRQVALEQVGRLVQSCLVLDLTPTIVLEACRGSSQHQLSIWDALIWASAKMNGVPYVLTEDAEHGRFLEGVTYLNPFDPRFDLAPLLA